MTSCVCGQISTVPLMAESNYFRRWCDWRQNWICFSSETFQLLPVHTPLIISNIQLGLRLYQACRSVSALLFQFSFFSVEWIDIAAHVVTMRVMRCLIHRKTLKTNGDNKWLTVAYSDWAAVKTEAWITRLKCLGGTVTSSYKNTNLSIFQTYINNIFEPVPLYRSLSVFEHLCTI